MEAQINPVFIFFINRSSNNNQYWTCEDTKAANINEKILPELDREQANKGIRKIEQPAITLKEYLVEKCE